MKKKRTAGVTVFGLMVIFWSFNYFFFPALYLLLSFFFRSISKIHTPIYLPSYFSQMFFGLCWLTCGIGILRLNNYLGRLLAVCLAVIEFCRNILFGIFTINEGLAPSFLEYLRIPKQLIRPSAYLIFFLNAIFLILLVIFFTRPKVREQFK